MKKSTRWTVGIIAGLVGIALFFYNDPIHEGKRLSTWVGLLRDTNESTQEQAKTVLLAAGPRAVASLLDGTEGYEPMIGNYFGYDRSPETLQVVIDMGPQALAALIDVVESEEYRSRRATYARMAICGIICKHPNQEPFVLSFLAKDLLNHSWSMEAGVAVEVVGRPAIPYLVEALKASPRCDELFIRALREIGGSEAVLPILVGWLDDDDGWIRRWGILSLQELSSEGKTAIPALRNLIKDEFRNGPIESEMTSSNAGLASLAIGRIESGWEPEVR